MAEEPEREEESTSAQQWEKLHPWVFPAAIFGVALLIRLLAINWGLPGETFHFGFHPDEFVNWRYAIEIDPLQLDFDPGFYNYGSLYLFILRLITDFGFWYGNPPNPEDPASLYPFVGSVLLVGRIVSAIAGAWIATLVFLVLRRFSGLFGASLGAAAIIVAPALVVHSRFATPDMLAAALAATSCFFALKLIPTDFKLGTKIAEPANLRFAVWAGVFAGLSAGTKYSGVLALVALGAVLICLRPPNWIRLGGLAVGATVLAFLISTPGALINTQAFLSGVGYELAKSGEGHGLIFVGTAPGWLFHTTNLFTGFGMILVILSVIGLYLGVRSRQVWAIALSAVLIVFFLSIATAEVKFMRYTFPLLFSLAVGFGFLMGEAHQRRKFWSVFIVFGFLGLGGVFGGGLAASLTNTLHMAGVDPRVETVWFFKRESEDNPNITVGLVADPWFYTAPFYPEVGAPRFVPFDDRHSAMLAADNPQVVRYVPENPAERFDWDVRLITELQPDYIVYSSFEFSDLARLQNQRGLSPQVQLQVDRSMEFMRLLNERYELARTFGEGAPVEHDMQYIRPYIVIWKKKAQSP
ncbi:MAG: ArnT family glycosyltransferase [Fimbriimonadaceae bacterium]